MWGSERERHVVFLLWCHWVDGKRSPRCFSECLSFPSTNTHTHTHWGTQGQNKRFGGINPNFKSSAFRSARITHSNLHVLTSLFPHLCLLASASSPPSLAPSYILPYHLSFHLILFMSPFISLITQRVTIIHSIQSTLFPHILLFPAFTGTSLYIIPSTCLCLSRCQHITLPLFSQSTSLCIGSFCLLLCCVAVF